MKWLLLIAAVLLVCQPCCSRPASEEESVVSVYTTLPSASGAPLDVYKQIADNIAERITQPFYRFFGFANSTQEPTTTKRPFEHIELGTSNTKTNLTNPNRDVEELSLDRTQKSDKKPEKIILFSSYLPVKQNFEFNSTDDNDIETDDSSKSLNDAEKSDDGDGIETNDEETDDNSLELDDVDSDDDESTERGGPFVYILELLGSIIQLLWGGFLAIFKPASTEEKRI